MTTPTLYAVADGVATITLNRPDSLNALDADLLAALRADIDRAAADEAVRAVLLTGAGRGFCSGADLAAASSADAGGGGLRRPGPLLRERYHPIILTIRNMPKPVISAVNGVAAGAGMSLALSADIVLAARSASFLQAFSRIGLVPDAGSTWLLDRLAGNMRARALAILAERIPAEQAQACGLVWRVIDDEALASEAGAMATQLASMPTRAHALIKQALNAAPGNTLEAQLEMEADLQDEAASTEDFREGVAAFLEKRKPEFKGR